MADAMEDLDHGRLRARAILIPHRLACAPHRVRSMPRNRALSTMDSNVAQGHLVCARGHRAA
jgi:hypothetical protein